MNNLNNLLVSTPGNDTLTDTPSNTILAQRRAAHAGLSLSRYLVELIKRDASASVGWPEGYFDLFVPIEGAELERPSQGKPGERERLE